MEDLELWNMDPTELAEAWEELQDNGVSTDERLAAELLNEIILRNVQTLNPDSMTPESLALVRKLLDDASHYSVYLSAPFGKQIINGEQTAIIKPKQWHGLSSFVALTSGKQELGFVRFFDGELLSVSDIKARQDEHRMSAADIDKKWPDAKALYLFRVRDVIPHEKPIDVGDIDGRQVIIQRKRVGSEEPCEKSVRMPIMKIDKALRVVKGVVLKAECEDLQEEIYSAETVIDASHKFMMQSQTVGLMHKTKCPDTVIVESWTLDSDTKVGNETLKAGTWMMAVKVLSDEIWSKVLAGEITGFSIGGWAVAA